MGIISFKALRVEYPRVVEAVEDNKVAEDIKGIFYGRFVNLKNEVQDHGFPGYSWMGRFIHATFSIEGEFVKDKIAIVHKISMIRTKKDANYNIFKFDDPCSDHDLVTNLERLMRTKEVSHEDVLKIINGQGTLKLNFRHVVKGKFSDGKISEGKIDTPKYSFAGTIGKNYIPLHGTMKIADLEYTGNFSYDTIEIGKIKSYDYRDEYVYEGECKFQNETFQKHGQGCLTTQNSRLIGSWFNDQLNDRLENREEFNNGIIKVRFGPAKVKMSVKINISDFKLDMQHLSDFFNEPPVIQDEKQTYELVFEGIEKNNRPHRGSLHIFRVFQFKGGYWSDRYFLECNAKIVDLIKRKERSVRYINGIEIERSAKQIKDDVEDIENIEDNKGVEDIEDIETAVVPEFHEEEGAAQLPEDLAQK